MARKARTSIVNVDIPLRDGSSKGIVGEATAEGVARIEELVAGAAKMFPEVEIRMIIRDSGSGARNFGFSHIPDKAWGAIFGKGKQAKN